MTQKNREGGDLRVQRTQKLILEALIELSIEKGFANVTVRDITKRAGINRATLYRYYRDKFDLLDQFAESVYRLPDRSPDEGTLTRNEASFQETTSGLVRMYEHVRANAKFYRVMLGRNGDPAFRDKVRQYIEKRMSRSLPLTEYDKKSIDLCLSYISSGSVGVLLWWLDQGMPYSAEEMAVITQRLIVDNLSAVLERGTLSREPKSPMTRQRQI